MTEIFREIDEALTYDRLMAWWRRYRILAIALLVVLMSIVLGWHFWQQARAKRLLQSGEIFFELLAKAQPSISGDERLLGGYEILWAFKRAQILGGQEKWDSAHEALEQIAVDKSLDSLYRDYARLWQASNSIKRDKLEEAQRLLSPIALRDGGGGDDKSLQAFALYLSASITLATGGKVEAAREELEKALSLGKIAPELRARIEQARRALSSGLENQQQK